MSGSTNTGRGASEVFSVDRLDAFERPAATVVRSGTPAGCRVTFENGWALSIQWGACTFSDNYDSLNFDVAPDSMTAECAAWKDGSDMLEWEDGNTVAGWLSMAQVQRLLDLMAADEAPIPLPGRQTA